VLRRLADGVDPAVINQAEAIAGSVPGVVHAHARARWTGRSLRIDIEGWVDGTLPTREADVIGHNVADQVSRQLPEADSLTWIPRAAPV
jgi:divalent metal cation (Fe/Co/Zn/Cd) transporter